MSENASGHLCVVWGALSRSDIRHHDIKVFAPLKKYVIAVLKKPRYLNA
jgi:hypothetical protein